jgi:hypothetical protein
LWVLEREFLATTTSIRQELENCYTFRKEEITDCIGVRRDNHTFLADMMSFFVSSLPLYKHTHEQL